MKRIIAYTDGACRNNGNANSPASWAVYFSENDTRNRSGILPPPSTNNIGELYGVYQSILAVEEELKNGCTIVIKTDSQYTISIFDRWAKVWERNGWLTAAKKSVKNKELIQLIQEKIKRYHIYFEKVKGHSGEIGNTAADAMCNDELDKYKTL